MWPQGTKEGTAEQGVHAWAWEEQKPGIDVCHPLTPPFSVISTPHPPLLLVLAFFFPLAA